MKKQLSLNCALEAAHIVYSMNVEKEASLKLAERFGFFEKQNQENRDIFYFEKEIINTGFFESQNFSLDIAREHFLWEWRAFVHSAIIHGLSTHAPAIVVVEYVRCAQNILQGQYTHYTKEMGDIFIDNPFQAYVQPVLEKKLKECPYIFIKRYFNVDLQDKNQKSEVPNSCIAGISASMAMLFSACEDAFEKYDYDTE